MSQLDTFVTGTGFLTIFLRIEQEGMWRGDIGAATRKPTGRPWLKCPQLPTVTESFQFAGVGKPLWPLGVGVQQGANPPTGMDHRLLH